MDEGIPIRDLNRINGEYNIRRRINRLRDQEAQAHNRLEKLTERFDADRPHDISLLPGHISHPIDPAQLQGAFHFEFDDLVGKVPDILQFVGAYILNNSTRDDPDYFQHLQDRVLDPEFLEKIYDMHHDDVPTQICDGSDAVNVMVDPALDWIKDRTAYPDSQGAWPRAYTAMRLLCFLAPPLRRFANTANPEQSQPPLPDGSNIINPQLRVSWVLHRAWIRVLHYRSLTVQTEPYGRDQIVRILAATAAFLELETDHVRPDVPQTHDHFSSKFSAMEEACQTISEMGRVLLQETRPAPSDGPYTREETIEYNLHNTQFNLPDIGDAPKWLLWALLLHSAKSIEIKLDEEHIEDVLINKRVVVEDEWWEVFDRFKDADEFLPKSAEKEAEEQRDWRQIVLYLRKIAQFNRCRRNYLLLRDWAKRRPWKQIYMFFPTRDDEGDPGGFYHAIEDFYTDIHKIEQDDFPPLYPADSPSNLSNVWSSLFPVHPITQDSAQLMNCEMQCALCLEEFKGKDILLELYCKHIFHYFCVRQAWDVEGLLRNRCPLCRGNEDWRLYAQAGITPENEDVWDNADITTLEDALEWPDNAVPDLPIQAGVNYGRYWGLEIENLIHSHHWDTNEQGWRQGAVDMSRLRTERRRRNMKRRDSVRQAGRGIWTINPERFDEDNQPEQPNP